MHITIHLGSRIQAALALSVLRSSPKRFNRNDTVHRTTDVLPEPWQSTYSSTTDSVLYGLLSASQTRVAGSCSSPYAGIASNTAATHCVRFATHRWSPAYPNSSEIPTISSSPRDAARGVIPASRTHGGRRAEYSKRRAIAHANLGVHRLARRRTWRIRRT